MLRSHSQRPRRAFVEPPHCVRVASARSGLIKKEYFSQFNWLEECVHVAMEKVSILATRLPRDTPPVTPNPPRVIECRGPTVLLGSEKNRRM